MFGIIYINNPQNLKKTNVIFKVPEEPKKVVPEKKKPVVVAPKKPEPPVTKGTFSSRNHSWRELKFPIN